jgi:hypothetical protein
VQRVWLQSDRAVEAIVGLVADGDADAHASWSSKVI